MKRQNKKAFTLVELLVVIAILAILAAVAVVGYTSFIKKAAISNDESLVAQLNQYMEAIRNDSGANNEFYHADINEDNVWELTQKILTESGINELDPQSAKYGYSFWFDLETDKYVLVQNSVALGNTSLGGLNASAAGETIYSPKPGNFFTEGHRYFLVNTTGEIGEFLNAVYKFNGKTNDGIASAIGLIDLYTRAQNLEDAAVFTEMLRSTVFITNNGTMVVDVDDPHTMLVVSADFNMGGAISNKKIGADGNEKYMDKDYPLIQPNKNTIVRLPNNTQVYGNSLHIKADGVDVAIDLGKTSFDCLDANFTSEGVKFYMNGVAYEIKANGIENSDVFEYGKTDVVTTLTPKNGLKDFAIKIEEKLEGKKFHTMTGAVEGDALANIGYMAWNQTSLKFILSNAVGHVDDMPVSSTAVTWELLTETDGLITINEATGEVTISDSYKLLEFDSFTVKATSVSDANANREFTINIVKLTGVEVGFASEYDPAWDLNGKVTLLYGGTDAKNEYNVAVKGASYGVHDAIVEAGHIALDLNVEVAFSCGHISCLGSDECCLHNQSAEHKAEECYVCTHSSHSVVCHVHNDSCCTHKHTTTLGITKCNMCTHDCSDNPCGLGGKLCGHYRNSCDDSCCGHNPDHDINCCNQTYTDANCTHKLGTSHGDESCYACVHVHDTNEAGNTCYGENNKQYCQHINPVCDKNTITTKDECKDGGKITVKVDHLEWGTTNAVIIDTSKLPVIANPAFKDANNIYVGNNNPITFADLFAMRDSSAKPGSNYVLVIFEDASVAEQYMMDAALRDRVSMGSGEFKVNLNEISLAGTGINTEIQFVGVSGEATPIYMAVYEKTGEGENAQYLRMSEDIRVNVVDGYNIRNYGDIEELCVETLDKDGVVTKRELKENIILLNDIKEVTSGTFFNIIGKTLYGNLCEMNVSNARNTNSIITITNATLRDVEIIGKVFSTFSLQTGDAWGAPVVRATGTSFITNSYIAHGRSPLRVEGTIAVNNVVLYGGRYCNVDLVSGTLMIAGKLTTVQQEVIADDGNVVIGIGISAWFTDGIEKKVQFAEGADLIQYNFLNENMAGNLPPVEVDLAGKTTVPLMQLKDPFMNIFNKKDAEGNFEYGDFIFNLNGNRYINSGLASIDKHNVSIKPSGGFDADYKAGEEITIQFTATSSDDNANITIYYDSSLFSEVHSEGKYINIPYDTNATDGKIEIKANETDDGQVNKFKLEKGKTYTCTLKFKKDSTRSGYGFGFDYPKDALSQMVVVDTNGNNLQLENYGNITYTYSLEGALGLLDTAIKGLNIFGIDGLNAYYEQLHGSGFHYDRVEIAVNTMPNYYAANDDMLKEYLELGTTYWPEFYELSYEK